MVLTWTAGELKSLVYGARRVALLGIQLEHGKRILNTPNDESTEQLELTGAKSPTHEALSFYNATHQQLELRVTPV